MFSYSEEFIQTHVEGMQTWTAHRADAARTERSGRCRPIRGRIEPLVASQWRVLFAENIRRSEAVRTRAARIGARSVAGRDGQRETGVQTQNAADLPTANHRI